METVPVVVAPDGERLCVLDDYISAIFTDRYSVSGDFELLISPTSAHAQHLQLGHYIHRQDVGSVYIIESTPLTQEVGGKQVLKVTGRTADAILARRIVAQQTQVNGRVGECVAQLLAQNAINPADTARALPVIFEDMSQATETIRQQFTGTNLLEAIQKLLDPRGVGYRVRLQDGGVIRIELYKGLDRTARQTANPRAIFSQDFGTLDSLEYIETSDGTATNVLVAGEGEGLERKTAWATSGSQRGLARYELYKDARNASTNNGAIPLQTYLSQLRDEGAESLHGITRAVAGRANFGSLKYRQDVSLGDICTVGGGELAASVDARLVEVIESIAETGAYTAVPTFTTGESQRDPDPARDTTPYLMTESSQDILAATGTPLIAQEGELDTQASPYDRAVKISELPDASATGVELIPAATQDTTGKLTLAALAAYVLGMLKTTSVNMPLSSKVSAYSSDTTPKIQRYGNTVQVSGAVKPNAQVAAGGSLTIGALPQGHRPARDVVQVCQGSGNALWLLTIAASGTVTASRYRTGALTNAAMPTTAWLIFNVCYVV